MVTPALMNPRSQYYLSFDLGYPNALEKALGYTGDAIMVHGACTSAGCFAMTDNGVAEIYALAREAFKGDQSAFQVQVFPFRMTPANMAKYRSDPNFDFWRNLEEGYDVFEVTRREPRVAACGRRYVFDPDPAVAAMLNPTLPCPDLKAAPDPQIAAHDADERAEMQRLFASGLIETPSAYLDGGMNLVFRQALLRLGAENLSKQTSRDEVAVSQPRAALADPYKPIPAAKQ